MTFDRELKTDLPTKRSCLRCLVCDEVDAAKHYGSICCSGCKGFFRRTVRFHKVYDCPFGQRCIIRKEFRNCCRLCRYNKCLSVGLNPLLVHGDRGVTNPEYQGPQKFSTPPELPLSPYGNNSICAPFSETTKTSIKTEPIDNEYEDFKCTLQIQKHLSLTSGDIPLGKLNLVAPFGTEKYIWDYYVTIERVIDNYTDTDCSPFETDFEIDLEISAVDAFHRPRAICKRTKLNWSAEQVLTSSHLKGTWGRTTQCFFDWVSFIPELHELSSDDLRQLIVGRSVQCIWMLFSHRSAINTTSGVVFSAGCYYPRVEENVELDSITKMCCERTAKLTTIEVIDEMRRLKITMAEYALLRLITLFMAVPCMSAEGRKIVQKARRKYTNALNELVQHRLAQNASFSEIVDRISRLVLILPSIEKISQLDDDAVGMMTVFNIAQMRSTLTYELHVGKNESPLPTKQPSPPDSTSSNNLFQL
uniref:Nuclear receptor domain-containing protein n=1 Tax=Panagrellus redivivus TaxID=6233 RepID=A0A7E4V429_PANRE